MASSNLQEHLADIDAHVQYMRSDVLTAIGDLIYGGAPGVLARLPIGPPGWFLRVDPNSPFKPAYAPITAEVIYAVPISIFQNKGDILTCDGAGNLVIVPVGLPGQYLTPDPTHLGGLKWTSLPISGFCPYVLNFSYECDSMYVAVL